MHEMELSISERSKYMNTHKSFIVICALFAVMTLFLSACEKADDPSLDDTDPVLTAASDKPIVSVLGNQDVSVTPIVSTFSPRVRVFSSPQL